MTEPADAAPTRKNRTMLFVLIGLFFVPLVAAFILYYGVGWKPAGGTNHGELLDPIRQLPAGAEPLQGKWALAYVGDGGCIDEGCQKALWTARQVRQLLNQEADRVARALLATGNCCDKKAIDRDFIGTRVFDVSDTAARDELLGLLPPGDHQYDLFVVDPRGNIVMRFDTREDPKGLLEDMKKLLKLSHIG